MSKIIYKCPHHYRSVAPNSMSQKRPGSRFSQLPSLAVEILVNIFRMQQSRYVYGFLTEAPCQVRSLIGEGIAALIHHREWNGGASVGKRRRRSRKSVSRIFFPSFLSLSSPHLVVSNRLFCPHLSALAVRPRGSMNTKTRFGSDLDMLNNWILPPDHM